MSTAQVVETSVTVNNNSPIPDYVRPDDQTQPTYEMTPGFKPFTIKDYVRHWTFILWSVATDDKDAYGVKIKKVGLILSSFDACMKLVTRSTGAFVYRSAGYKL